MNLNRRSALITCLLIGLTGCGAMKSASESIVESVASPVDIVKKGLLPGFDTTTIGKAFEGTFKNPAWTSFETPKGQTVVQFDGEVSYHDVVTLMAADGRKITSIPEVITEECHKKALLTLPLQSQKFWRLTTDFDECVVSTTTLIPVRFQFTLSADKKSFTISTFDNDPFGVPANAVGLSKVLAFIYNPSPASAVSSPSKPSPRPATSDTETAAMWTAGTTTASNITGDIGLTSSTLTIKGTVPANTVLAGAYPLTLVREIPTNQLADAGKIVIRDHAASARLYKVRVPGMCDSAEDWMLVVYSAGDVAMGESAGEKTLSLAFFSGAGEPNLKTVSTGHELCGTFGYFVR